VIHTTLQLCKDNNACAPGYEKLIKYVGLDYPKDEPISLLTVLESNDLEDTLWVLESATKEDSKIFRMKFGVWCAEQCYKYWEAKYPNDDRVKKCIDATHNFINDSATQVELAAYAAAARSAATDAINAAAYAAADAAYAAAYAAYAAYAAADAAYAAAAHAQKEQFSKMLNEHKG